MRSQLLTQAVTPDTFKNIRLVATDMDGTLTQRGKFTTALFQAFENLAASSIEVLIVTGRSAGWVSGLVNYLPVAGALAENGGIFYSGDVPIALTEIGDLFVHRQRLAEVYQVLKTKFPQIKESADNRFRITDWTFDIAGLSLDEVQAIAQLCYSLNWGFTYSNVQCHIKPQNQDKAAGLLQVLAQYPQYTIEQILTVGDSPNDESLFDGNYFPISVGVANVLEYADQLNHHPTYITAASEGEGFCELTQYLTYLI